MSSELRLYDNFHVDYPPRGQEITNEPNNSLTINKNLVIEHSKLTDFASKTTVFCLKTICLTNHYQSIYI
jgi:hypothetical protein